MGVFGYFFKSKMGIKMDKNVFDGVFSIENGSWKKRAIIIKQNAPQKKHSVPYVKPPKKTLKTTVFDAFFSFFSHNSQTDIPA
jgi:hypothetical protein